MGKSKRIERNNKKKSYKGILEDSEVLHNNENELEVEDSFFKTKEEVKTFEKLKKTCEKIYREQEKRKKRAKNMEIQENVQKKDNSKNLHIKKANQKHKKIKRRF